MLFLLLIHVCLLLIDVIWLGRRCDIEKDIEIRLVRQQVRILQRTQPRSPRISRWEQRTLVLLVNNLTARTTSARTWISQVVLLCTPDPCWRGSGNGCAAYGPSKPRHRRASLPSLLSSQP
jgi:hypothetical protein